MIKTILVPLDGSELAERALPWAVKLAEAAGARLVLFHVRSALVAEDGPAFDIRPVAARIQPAGVEVEPITQLYFDEDISRAIRDAAAELGADLIVMSTHGRGGLGRWLYGSVADAVLRHSEVPVLLVSAACEQTWPEATPFRILVPLDGSGLSETAIDPAAEIAAAVGGELVLYRVVEPPTYGLYAEAAPYVPFDDEAELASALAYLDDLAAGLREGGAVVRTRASIGMPTSAIARAAAEEGAGLIAMATHGRGGIARFVLGSVATGVLQRAHVPLLLVRPAAMQRKDQTVGAQAAPTEAPAAPPAGPTVTLTLSLAEVDLLERGLADLLFSQRQDWRLAGPTRDLLWRLRSAAARASREPASAGR